MYLCTHVYIILSFFIPKRMCAASAGELHKRQLGGGEEDHDEKEYAFEMACSNIRYGEGVTREVGMDLVNLSAKSTCVFTDKNVTFYL